MTSGTTIMMEYTHLGGGKTIWSHAHLARARYANGLASRTQLEREILVGIEQHREVLARTEHLSEKEYLAQQIEGLEQALEEIRGLPPDEEEPIDGTKEKP